MAVGRPSHAISTAFAYWRLLTQLVCSSGTAKWRLCVTRQTSHAPGPGLNRSRIYLNRRLLVVPFLVVPNRHRLRGEYGDGVSTTKLV